MLPNKSYTPDDILKIAWHRRWVILIPFAVVTVAVAVFTSTLPEKYKSETVILVVPQRVPTEYVRSTVTTRIEDRLLTIQQQIMSRSRLEPIITEYGLYAKLRRELPMEEVVERMRDDDVKIAVERGDAFRVSFVNENPQVAQHVVEKLANLFIAENLRDRAVLAEDTNEFLDQQLEEARKKLVEHETALEKYRSEHSGELPTQVNANLQAIQTLQAQLSSLDENVNKEKERRLLIERQIIELENTPPTPVSVAGTATAGPGGMVMNAGDSAEKRLEDARTQLKALELKFTPEHPDIRTAKRVIRDLEVEVKAEQRRAEDIKTGKAKEEDAARTSRATAQTTAELALQAKIRGLKEEMSRLDARLVSLAESEQNVSDKIAGYQGRVDAAPRRESELVELTRDYETLRQGYTGLLGKRQESKIAANLEQHQVGEQFKVLDPPRVPERPFSPNRLRLNAIGGVGGMAIGFGIVILLEYLDRSLKTAGDVMTVLKLPVLAQVPLMPSDGELRQSRRRRRLVAVAVTLFLVLTGTVGAYALWLQRAS
jgi:polysaccharide chain length determinant protein (PEP-CTERM system associated)